MIKLSKQRWFTKPSCCTHKPVFTSKNRCRSSGRLKGPRVWDAQIATNEIWINQCYNVTPEMALVSAEMHTNFYFIVPVHVRMCPYIIKIIGLGLGLTIWDLSNMLMGWFTGYFGLFGIPKKGDVKIPSMNYVGLVMASISLIFFSLASAYDTPEMRDVKMSKSDPETNSTKGRRSHFEMIHLWFEIHHWKKKTMCEKWEIACSSSRLYPWRVHWRPTQQCLFLMFSSFGLLLLQPDSVWISLTLGDLCWMPKIYATRYQRVN